MAERNMAQTPVAETIPVTLYEGRQDIELSGDYIIPDTMADIKRVLRVTAKPRISGKFISDENLEYEGTVEYSVLFVTDENKIRHINFTADFENSMEIEGIDDSTEVTVKPETATLNQRLVNPRKLNIKSKLYIHISAIRDKDASQVTEDGYGKSAEFEYDTVTLPSTRILRMEEGELRISDDLELEGTYPPIQEIIDVRVEISVTECKPSEDSLLCRGEAYIVIAYESESGDFTEAVKRIPISQTLDLDGATPGCICIGYAQVDDISAEAQLNSYGENRIVALDVIYTIGAECAKIENVTINRDIYSTCCECDVTYSDITLLKAKRAYTTNFTVNASVPRADVNAADAGRVLDTSARVEITGITVDEERGKVIVEGNAEIAVIAAGSSAQNPDEHEYTNHSFTHPIRCELDGSGADSSTDYHCYTNVTSSKGRLDTDTLYTDFEVALTMLSIGSSVERAVETVKLDRENIIDTDSRAPILLYYPSETETLWGVAKRYKVKREDVARANNMTEAELAKRDQPIARSHPVVLIPRPEKRAIAELVI